MTAISKVVSLLAISVALTLSGSPVFAKSGGGPSQVKTSGTSAGPGAGGSIVRRLPRCSHGSRGACTYSPPQGATSGGNPINRGPGHPTLHPK